MGRRAAQIVALMMLFSAATGVHADEPTTHERRQLERDAFGSLIAGLALFSIGTAIQSTYFCVADQNSDRLLVRLPLAGPIAVAAEGHASISWTTALAFSAGAQALGVLSISIAIPRLLELRH